MAYLSIYRKYRPTTFEGIIGQNHITSILKNQIKADRIGHAYLFCGSRGTGKTSAAKILSRAVNCLSPVDGSPCNKCAVCEQLSNPSSMDILEIDAASNNRVDEIREIRDKVQFTPITGRYKVYIIDEVHMLSDSAFNALLKTLEEPPKHAIFILATTEAHKLPATILSRCMRFDFKLIGVEEIFALLKKIFDDLKKKYEDEALYEVARAGEGSVRDALSILDMCYSYGGGKLRYADVLEILGATDRNMLLALADSLIGANINDILNRLDGLLKKGKSASVLCRDILKHLRDLAVITTCTNSRELLNLPSELFNSLEVQSKKASKEMLLKAVEILCAIEPEMRYSLNPAIVLEVALLKICALSGAAEAGAAMPQAATKAAAVAPVTPQVVPHTGKSKVSVTQTVETVIRQVPAPPTQAFASKSPQAIWGGVVKSLREQNQFALYSVTGNIAGNFVSGKNYVINANNQSDVDILSGAGNFKIIKELINALGGDYNIVFEIQGKQKPVDSDIKSVEELVGKDRLIIEK
jgi:DNA polymerase III subunit gamma/tau